MNNFIYSKNSYELKENDSLIDNGIINSTGVLELIDFIEEEFSIDIHNAEIVPDNFDTISKMEKYIQNKIDNVEK